jgi:acyl-CoA thioester hydrolase
MILSFRSSVNSWECDENDHLNVRFYVAKHWQSLCAAAATLGLKTVSDPDEYIGALRVQHIRFLQEARLATPLSGYVGIVAASELYLDILTEIRHSQTQQPLSTCVHRLQVEHAAVPAQMPLPEYAQPRGIPPEDLSHTALSLAQARESGFFTVGMGLATSEDCTATQQLRVHHYMGRISDAMPHLWGQFVPDAASAEGLEEGGAVLEYRLHYHRPLLLGDAFEIVSGVQDVSAKVQRFAHLLYHSVDGQICVSAQAAAVRMDLRARRAIALPEDRLALMREHLILPGPA